MHWLRALLKYTALFVSATLLFAGVFIWFEFAQHAQIPRGKTVTFLVKPASTFREVTDQLAKQEIITYPSLFAWLAHYHGYDKRLKAGKYRFTGPLTARQILLMLAQGKTAMAKLTVVEGWTFAQLVNLLAQAPTLEHRLKNNTPAQIMRALGYSGEDPEGRFYPSTYLFAEGDSDIHFLQRAYQTMQKHLTREWQQRDPKIIYQTPYEALIVASLIEKESAYFPERTKIAGVIMRRLQKKMLLQIDPTVIYGLGENYKGHLTHEDLHTPSAYNTYTQVGLPPTPIALPSLNAIHAALHPDEGDALYFVAKGDGSHIFTATLSAHQKAVVGYIHMRREKLANKPTDYASFNTASTCIIPWRLGTAIDAAIFYSDCWQ